MRINIPTGSSINIINATGKRKGFSIQNVGAVDVYYSDDQRSLDSATTANLPTVGHLLAAASPAPLPVVYPFYIGKLYARAQGNGALLELIVYDVDNPC